MLKENPRKLQFTRQFSIKDPVHPAAWYAFLALQAVDVWTTTRGVAYDCVEELNPLLPKVPHRDRLILHKVVFLTPFNALYEYDLLTYQEMIFPFATMAYVVHNNLKVIDRAKQNCSKRG